MVRLALIVVAAFIATVGAAFFVIARQYDKEAIKLVRKNVNDVILNIKESVGRTMLFNINNLISGEYIYTADIDDEDDAEDVREMMEAYYKRYGDEIDIVNPEGIITLSGIPDRIGINIRDDERYKGFLPLLDKEVDRYVQELDSFDLSDKESKLYAGASFPDNSGFVILGMMKEECITIIDYNGDSAAINRRIGEDGYFIICDESFRITNSYRDYYCNKPLEESGIQIDPEVDPSGLDMKCDVFGVPSYVCIEKGNPFYVIGVYPISEGRESFRRLANATLLILTLVFSILSVAFYLLMQRIVVADVVKVNDALGKITEGNLDVKVDVRDTREFDSLSSDINMTVDRLKGYIAQAEARIDEELSIAKGIQTSAIPNTFPPFPDHHEFELFARMEAAKVVGGDFYDYHMINDDTLGFIIADVSGKSIPGAMFMMRSKTVIKDLAESGLPAGEVFTVANRELCKGNEAEMFLTAWMGYLDLESGLVKIANAGHNPPVLIRDGAAEFVRLKSGVIMAEFEDMEYIEQTLMLQKGDILFLYTDGVTEAMNADGKLYGENRLLKILSFGSRYPEPSSDNGIAESVCSLVKEDVDRYVNGAEQSDDITMLCIRYLG